MGECGRIPGGEFKKMVAFEVVDDGKCLRLENATAEAVLLQALIGEGAQVRLNLMNNRMNIEAKPEIIARLIKLLGA